MSSDASLLAITELKGPTTVVRTADGVRLHVLDHHLEAMTTLFAPRGDVLYATSRSTSGVVAWSMATGTAAPTLQDSGASLVLKFWPDGRRLQVTTDGEVHIWDTVAGADLAHVQFRTWGVEPTRDGKRLSFGFGGARAIDMPSLYNAGCSALRGIHSLESVTAAELGAVLAWCRARGASK